MKLNPDDVIVVWFSCGAASAVAAKKTVELFGAKCIVKIVNTPIAEEDPDNRRFLLDVQDWIGLPIELCVHPRFPSSSAVEVWNKKTAMAFPTGAPCTQILKKHARFEWEKRNRQDLMVFGFTADEKSRYNSLQATEITPIIPVLIELGITKNNCFNIVKDAGIELPASYRRGYNNANCIGCVKATSPTYWNHVREKDPGVFAARAEQSRRLGVRLVVVKGERIYLDELNPNTMGRPMKSLPSVDCGVLCDLGVTTESIIDAVRVPMKNVQLSIF
jgi:hypothetical protein